MKKSRSTATKLTRSSKVAAALSISALLFTAACSSDPDTGPDTGGTNTEGTSHTEGPTSDSSDEVVNGAIYQYGELRPIAEPGNFDYLIIDDAGEARFEAVLAGTEDPGRTDPIYILIKQGEPVPENVKDEIEQRYFQQGARILANTPSLPDGVDYNYDRFDFMRYTGGVLERLGELSASYIDIVFLQGMVDENHFQHYNYHIGMRVWDNPGVSADTQSVEEYLANYEAYLDEQGITERELWVFEPEVTAPWIQ